jgi:hypothetical protein
VADEQRAGGVFPGHRARRSGGPTGNAFTAQIYEDLFIVYARDQRAFIQFADGGKLTAVWGMDQSATREAADIFVKEGILERFLHLVWRRF